jgi:hypothetical protein
VQHDGNAALSRACQLPNRQRNPSTFLPRARAEPAVEHHLPPELAKCLPKCWSSPGVGFGLPQKAIKPRY